jgi:polysaccharide biosynthesis transport protein
MSEYSDFARRVWLRIVSRRPWLILGTGILGSLLGFVLSFALPEKYTSQSSIMVETHDLPAASMHSAPSTNLSEQIAKLRDVFSQDRVNAMISRMGIANPDKSVEQAEAIRRHVRISAVLPNSGESDNASAECTKGSGCDIVRFRLAYTGASPAEAQLICNGLTLMLLQSLNSARQETTASSALLQAVGKAKHDLDEQDAKLAQFRKRHRGQLPADVDENMGASMDLNAQLNMLSQKIELARQEKTEAESQLSQRLSLAQRESENRNSASKGVNSTALNQQLSDLQSQLLQLQAQYAEDHPDVVKTKAEIAGIEKELEQANPDERSSTNRETESAVRESLEIRQLRSQIQHDDQVLGETTREEKRVQNELKALQAKLVVNSTVTREYQQLIRDRDAAQKTYAKLSTKPVATQGLASVNPRQQTDEIRMFDPANLPRVPSSPNRLLFAISGWLSVAVVLRFTLWLGQPSRSTGASEVHSLVSRSKTFAARTRA